MIPLIQILKYKIILCIINYFTTTGVGNESFEPHAIQTFVSVQKSVYFHRQLSGILLRVEVCMGFYRVYLKWFDNAEK